MATLTLDNRRAMANDTVFLGRLKARLLTLSNYWMNYSLTDDSNNYSTYYSLQRQKQKRMARDIQNGNYPNLTAFAEYFLMVIAGEDLTLVTISGSSVPQLNDAAFEDGSLQITYDKFAGVQAGDLSEPIEW